VPGAVLREFSRHDWPWYRHLALAVVDHTPLDVSPVGCPVTFVAGRYGSLVDAGVRASARAVPGPGSASWPGPTPCRCSFRGDAR
jgi:3-oxoadipate enol-lactonase